MKDPFSMQISIRFHSAATRNDTRLSHFFPSLSCWYLLFICSHSAVSHYSQSCLQYLFYSLLFMWTHFCSRILGKYLISSSQRSHLMLLLSLLFFLFLVFIRGYTDTLSSLLLFDFIIPLYLSVPLHLCPQFLLCLFTLCPSQLIALSVLPVFCPPLFFCFSPLDFSFNLFTFSILCLV